MGLWDQILIQGDDSLLRQELVKKRALTGSVEGGINLLGNMFNYQGPMLWMGDVYHDSGTSADQVIQAIDTVMDRVRSEGATDAMLDRARVKLKSEFYNAVDSGFARADMLASLALFDDRPQRINEIEQKFADVTPALMKKTADDVFQTSNRTILQITPGAAAPAVQKGVN